MSTNAILTVSLEAELRDEFMAAIAEDKQSASQVIQEMMTNYVLQRREAREYENYLRRKVNAARKQRDEGLYFSNEEVEAEAAVRRASLLRRIGG